MLLGAKEVSRRRPLIPVKEGADAKSNDFGRVVAMVTPLFTSSMSLLCSQLAFKYSPFLHLHQSSSLLPHHNRKYSSTKIFNSFSLNKNTLSSVPAFDKPLP